MCGVSARITRCALPPSGLRLYETQRTSALRRVGLAPSLGGDVAVDDLAPRRRLKVDAVVATQLAVGMILIGDDRLRNLGLRRDLVSADCEHGDRTGGGRQLLQH